jgi:hypothetical protein
MKNWLKVFGFGPREAPKLFLSSIAKSNGGDENILVLSQNNTEGEIFGDVKIKILKTQNIEGSRVPKIIEVEAKNDTKTLIGTFQFDDLLEAFVLNDHLNTLESVAASSQPKLKRFKFRVRYDFIMEENGEKSNISGEALSEFIDVIPPKGIRRRRTRE